MPPTTKKFRRAFACLPLLLASCQSVQTAGPLKDVLDGEIFNPKPVNQAELRKKEQEARDAARLVPPPTTDEGPVGLKIPL